LEPTMSVASISSIKSALVAPSNDGILKRLLRNPIGRSPPSSLE
jgi:hypothetical protein